LKKRIFLTLIILIAFLSVGVISASEINMNDNYTAQVSDGDLLAVDNGGVESDSSNILSINNVDTNVDENIMGAGNESTKKAVKIDAPDITLYYKNGTKFIATLSDIDGNKLANQTLLISINGINYTRTTSSDGQASIAVNLNPGEYNFDVYYNGNDYYLDTKTTAKCEVYPTISGENLVKYFRNSTQYYATFLDGDGSPLTNATATFNINGVFYNRKTNANGTAQLNINLEPKEYILTAIHPVTGYTYSNTITVLSTISGDNLTKVYRDSHQYYATFLDGDGSPLTNAVATFNIHGVFYDRKTNENGTAQLNINLEGGEYIITAYHPNGEMHANTIKVLGSSSTYMIVNNYTYFADDTQTIDVTLMNELGYGVPNQNIDMDLFGRTSILTTGDDGVASIDVILPPGYFTPTFTYAGSSPYKASTATGTITIMEGYPVYFNTSSSIIYYNNKESFDVTVFTDNGVVIPNEPVYFTVNGVTYKRTTNANGTAKLNINLEPGIYPISYRFNSTNYEDLTENIDLLVIDGSKSELVGENTTVAYGAGEKFYVSLNVGDVGLPYRTVILNINGINYTRTTDEYGFAGIAINLNVGTYLIKYYYAGEDRIDACQGEAYVRVKENIPTSLKWMSASKFIADTDIILKVALYDDKNNPLANQAVFFKINSKEYGEITDSQGIASLTIKLNAGTYLISYSFDGSEDYYASEGSSQITVSKSGVSSGFGYWSFGRDMESIDLAQFASLGTTDILLNFYAFTLYGESKVVSWIEKANSYGINVHIWMQVFYSGGSWVNPVSGGSVNQAYFNQVINEAKYYAGLKGVAGVHFDYLRYPGTAYKTSGGTAAITEFVRQATIACRAVNPNIIMSAAVMPETTNNIYYYGQDIPAITKYLDVIVPMQYKGNYGTGTSWLASTTKWFVQNSNGAEVWSGLQAYVSDDNPTKLTYTELFDDSQTVIDNGADGVIMFRYGLSVFLDFNDLVDPSYGDVIDIDDVLSAASDLKAYIEGNYTLPGKVSVGLDSFTVPQFLYLMSEALMILNGDVSEDIVSIIVTDPENNDGDVIYSQLDKAAYMDVCKRVNEYCTSNSQAPSSMTALIGDIKYETMVYMFARTLDFYVSHSALPAMVLVNNFLDQPTLTVNMLPSYSTEEYRYINYTTTWLNYCPNCEYYGTLLINPKGTYEGELTCYHCDSDYCGVTGHEKIIGSTSELTRLSESVPTDPGESGDEVSILSIVEGASYMAAYYAENEEFPDYIIVEEGKYTIQQFLYLMTRATVQIEASNFSPVTLVDMTGPETPSGDAVDGDLSKTKYLDVANRVANFISNNNLVPNYASSDLGRIAYATLVDTFSRVLDYYGDNGALPASVHVKYVSPSSKSISDLSKSLISGLTSTREKATALFNYVRDYITYEFYYDTQKGAEGTLIAGSGNCCDQAQLLVAMGRSVNLTVRFATGYCHFSSGSWYGHVWAQFLVDGVWINADPTSTRNSFGVINNWDTSSYTDRGTYDILPY